MTKFITYYNLCPIHDQKEFQGIAPDRDEGNVITTLGRNIVMVIKITTQKQVRSWSVLEKLSAKVVYDRHSQKYVGVFGNRAIRCWDETTSDVNRCKKLKFQKSIADLICNGDDTLVLYHDGTCETLAEAIQSRKEEVPNSNQLELVAQNTLTNASVASLADGRQVLTYFDRQNRTGEVEMVRLPLQRGGVPVRFSLKRESLGVRVVGHAVIEGDDCPMLLTIWSDKRLFLLSLHDSTPPEKSPGNFVSMLTALKVDSPLSVLGVSRHFVAIYGSNSGQEGASLLLYNTQFKVVKAKQFFKVYFDFSRLWSVDEHILLAMGQNLSVVSYRMSKELLSELVGTQVNNDFQTPIEGDYINEEDPLQECLQYTNEISSIQSEADESNANDSSSLQANGKNIPFEAVNEFEHELNAASKLQMNVELVEVDRALEDIQINLMSNCNDDGFVNRELQLIARQLERCGASEHEITEKLLTVLIKADLPQEIATCLRRYTNISEKMLAKTMSYVLNKYTPKSTEETTKLNGKSEPIELAVADALNDETITSEFPNVDILAPHYQRISNVVDLTDVLNLLLACSFDPSTIAVHIRREIDYTKVLLLLEHLYELLTSTDETATSIEERPSFVPQCVQFELQLLRWFGVFLNTHFQKLALSKDVRLMELLFKWHELFTLYKREAIELEQVAALLYNIVQRKEISKGKNYSKWYSIEEVVLF